MKKLLLAAALTAASLFAQPCPQGWTLTNGVCAAPPARGFTWRGSYSGGAAYAPYDVVQYIGSSWICVLASSGNTPGNPAYWALLASKGSPGTNGTNGVGVVATPASSSATCTAGQFAFDLSYAYFCVSQNTWNRVAITGGW